MKELWDKMVEGYYNCKEEEYRINRKGSPCIYLEKWAKLADDWCGCMDAFFSERNYNLSFLVYMFHEINHTIFLDECRISATKPMENMLVLERYLSVCHKFIETRNLELIKVYDNKLKSWLSYEYRPEVSGYEYTDETLRLYVDRFIKEFESRIQECNAKGLEGKYKKALLDRLNYLNFRKMQMNEAIT